VENLNLSVSSGQNPKRSQQYPVSLQSLTDWINRQSYPDTIKEKLIAKAQKYPASALSHFKANIHTHLQNISKSSK
jgi:hypothetical protein